LAIEIVYLVRSRQTKSKEKPKTRSPAVAEIADRTVYDALFNDHLVGNTHSCLQ